MPSAISALHLQRLTASECELDDIADYEKRMGITSSLISHMLSSAVRVESLILIPIHSFIPGSEQRPLRSTFILIHSYILLSFHAYTLTSIVRTHSHLFIHTNILVRSSVLLSFHTH